MKISSLEADQTPKEFVIIKPGKKEKIKRTRVKKILLPERVFFFLKFKCLLLPVASHSIIVYQLRISKVMQSHYPIIFLKSVLTFPVTSYNYQVFLAT